MSIDFSTSITSNKSRLTTFLKILQILYRLNIQQKNNEQINNNRYIDKTNIIKTIKKVLAIYKPLDSFSVEGGESEATEKIRDLVLNYLDEETINKEVLEQNINDIMKTSVRKDIATDIFKDMTDNENELVIKALESELNKIIHLINIRKLGQEYTFDIDKKLKNGITADELLDKLIEDATRLKKSIQKTDLAIVNEVDLDNLTNVANIFQTVKETNEAENFKFKIGIQAINFLTSGGYKNPEFVIWNALAHSYKSGWLATSLVGIARYNKPVLTDPTKIPLLLYVSLEDDLDILFEFLYRQMYLTDNKVKADLNNVTKEDMAAYVKDRLQATGFKVKFIRVDPSDWSFQSFFTLVETYEKAGYELQSVILDYLSLIPTVGCVSNGVMGSDTRDLFRRVRNFFAKRKCSFISAHQLSPDAQTIARENLTGDVFLNKVMSKGFYDGSKKLIQEMDLEMYSYKYSMNGKDYLAVGKGKHKGSKVMKSDDKIMILPFPTNGEPIPDDIGEEESMDTNSEKEINNEIKGLLGVLEFN